ncbi:MAG: type II toxin-antitoxin system RelE/ParE family toxin [Acidobacteriaceae bacterium]
MNHFRLSNAAHRDLDDIWEYIAADNLDAADRRVEHLREVFHWLSSYPAAGHKRRDIEKPVLFWAEGNYEIVYRALAGFIEIDAILHGSRDIPSVLRERDPEQ